MKTYLIYVMFCSLVLVICLLFVVIKKDIVLIKLCKMCYNLDLFTLSTLNQILITYVEVDLEFQ